MFNSENFSIALALTMIAGLSTGIGGIIVLFTKKFNSKFLSLALGLSAGVMIFISMIELFHEANMQLNSIFGEQKGYIYTLLSFFGGIALIALIDNLIPSNANPHEFQGSISEGGNIDSLQSQVAKKDSRLMRLGILSILAIAIHNFPEGMATFFSSMSDPKIGISIAIAVAIHNIPEGIMVAIPIYYATKKKGKAIGSAFLSGLAEPIGGIIGYALLFRIFNASINGVILALVAGIMVYISLDELLPTAEKYGAHHYSIIGVITGMIIMAFSLIFV